MVWGLLSFVVLIYIFGGEPVGNQFITYKSIPGYAIGILIVALLLWLWFGTGYQIKRDMLNVRFGPFRKRIKISDIKIISSIGSSLSSEKITIHYGKFDVISVSPRSKIQFIDFLLAINPKIQLDNNLLESKEN